MAIWATARLELTLTQQISTDPITLGQAQLGVVLEPSSQATLLTDRPGAEYLLLRSGRMLIDRLAYLDLSANRKFQENLQFSLNNLTSTDIADVIISVDGDISDYIDISTNYVEKVPANGSVIVSYSIKLANLNTTEDHIVDGQLIIATWEEGHRVGFPIRIRVAEIENLHNNEPYHYIPYSGPWPTGPIMYGEDFINTWFKEANLVGGRAAGHSLGSVRLSQDVIIEGEAFTLAASLANLLPDKHIRIAATDLVITTTEGTHVTELFEVTETTSLSSDLAPSDQAYGSWRIAPQSDQHLGGTVADGIEYHITVEITYEIEGRAGKTLLPPLSITVKPVPSFAIRYHVETEIGSSANQVRIDLHVTNTGPGTASRLEIGFPQLHFATALYEVVNPEPMVFIEIGPDESVSGSWWLNFMVPTVDIAAIVSSLESATAEVTGGLSDIRIEAPVDFEFVTSTDIADLEQAVSDLLQASRDKFKAEQVVLAKFFNDLHSIARDSQDLIVAELQVHLWQFILKSSVSMLDIWSAMTGLREPFKPGMDLLETLERAGDFFEYTQALATLPFDMFELMYHALLSYQRYDELQESFDKLNSLIGKPDTTLNDFLNYVSEDIPYYRLNPHVLMVEFENLPQEPSQEEVLDMLAKAITSGAEGISGNELLEELDRLSNDTINLLSLVKETAIFPVDLLHAEITRLTQIIETVGTGYGVEQEKRETLPAYWYSVGEKGAWYPVSLQNWGFGIMYEDYINVLKAKGLLYSNFALHWEVIASALESNIWFGAYSALGTLMPAPFVGTSWQMAVGEVWDHVASLYDSAFQSLRSTELMIYDWLSELVRSLELHHQYESAGLWQMFSDFENHIAYILEHNPIDPDVSVRVESTNFSDIRVGEGNFIGADQAEIVVTNDCDLSLQIKPLVRIGAGGNTLGTFEGTPLTLAPGETGTSGVILVLPRSILYGNSGYDAEIIFDAWDPVTLSREQIGPFYDHVYVGTDEELAYFTLQHTSQPLGGKVGNKKRFERTIDVSAGTNEVRVTLIHSDDTDLDLHLFDENENHVGFSEGKGGDEIRIPNAAFSGSDYWRQVITVKPTGSTQFRLEVAVNEAYPDSLFAVAVQEIPEYPALLETSTERIEIATNEAEIEFYLSAQEWGGTTGISNLQVSLQHGNGTPIVPDRSRIELSQPGVPPGGHTEITVALTFDDQIADAEYSGTLVVTGFDGVSGEELSQKVELAILIDRQAPAVPQLADLSGPAEDLPIAIEGTSEPNVTIQLFADEAYAGEVQADDQGRFEFEWLIIGLGDHVLQALAVDLVGNKSELSAPITVTSNVDPFAPITTAVLTGDEGIDGWYTSQVMIALEARDVGGSGIQHTEIAVNGGGWADYVGPVSIATEGIAKVSFRSTDNAGNEEIVRSIYVKIDTQEPESIVDQLPAQIVDVTEFAVTWSGSDPAGGSELAGYDIYVSTDQGPYALWMAETTETSALFAGERGHSYAFYSRAQDHAGNIEEPPAAPDAFTEVAGTPPEVVVGSDAEVNEGEIFSRVAHFTDTDPNDSWTVTVNYGDGTGAQPLPTSHMTFALSHVYADDGTYLVTVTVTDSYEKSDSEQLTVTVLNVAPSIATDMATVTADEGTVAANTGTYSDPGEDAVTLSASVGVLVDNGDGTWSWSFPARDGPDDSQTVAITATDSDGAFTRITFDLWVDNVKPVAAIAGDTSAVRGQPLVFEGSFFDPGTLDTHITSWEVLDGTETVVEIGSGLLLDFTPKKLGTLTIKFTVTDDDGGTGTATQTLSVANWALEPDPEDPGTNILRIGGSESRDKIEIKKRCRSSQVVVKIREHKTKVRKTFYIEDALSGIIVYAQGGDDTVKLSRKIEVDAEIHGGAGDDKIYSGSGDDRLLGGGGNDKLYSGRGSDVLEGGGGHDRLYGDGGDDYLAGDDGNDRLYGGCGGDTLDGGTGNDRIYGNWGDDQLFGGDGDDRLYGGWGSDILAGGDGNDRLYGSSGDDRLFGGNGIDKLYGGRGDDYLDGGSGHDRLYGSWGDDQLFAWRLLAPTRQ